MLTGCKSALTPGCGHCQGHGTVPPWGCFTSWSRPGGQQAVAPPLHPVVWAESTTQGFRDQAPPLPKLDFLFYRVGMEPTDQQSRACLPLLCPCLPPSP